MNEDFLKIKQKIRNFCDSKPAEGFEIQYLEKAERILDLYSEANARIEEVGNSTPITDILKELESVLGEGL